MTDRFEERGRRAAAAVRDQTARLDGQHGLDDVVRRAQRPRATTVLALLLVALVAGPALVWLLSADPRRVELADDAPVVVPETEEPEVQPTPEPVETTEPAEPTEPDQGVEPEDDHPEQGPDPIGEFGSEAVTGELPPGDTVAFLTAVRVGGHEGFDRVVLEFEDLGTSAYRVAYQDPPILSAGKGEEIAIDGAAFLELRLFSATGVDFGADGSYRLTYEGPDRVSGDTALVTEVVQTGDFEATLTWVVGLDARAPFAVTVLEHPLRLVVDIQTP